MSSVGLKTFANRVEYQGISAYGSRKASPRVGSVELSTALMRVMGESEKAARMKVKAEEFAEKAGEIGGQVKACEKILEILTILTSTCALMANNVLTLRNHF